MWEGELSNYRLKNGSVLTTGFDRVRATWKERYRENKKGQQHRSI
jgi:hypothetical protein